MARRHRHSHPRHPYIEQLPNGREQFVIENDYPADHIPRPGSKRALQYALENAQDTLATITLELTSLQTQLSSYKSDNFRLQQELQRSRHAYPVHAFPVPADPDAEEQIAELKESLKEKKLQLRDMQEKLRSKEDREEELVRENAMLRRGVLGYETAQERKWHMACEEKVAQIRAYQTALETKQQVLRATDVKLAEGNQIIDRLDRKIEEKNGRIRDLEEKLRRAGRGYYGH